MKTFAQWYLERVAQVKSVLCVGLDPTPAHVPPIYGDTLRGMEDYLRCVIEIAAEKAAVVKPQYAYYGAMGPRGVQMLIRLVKFAHRNGLPVILDAKRADIGPTMEQYAVEVFDRYGVDACTWVPYLGAVIFPSKGTQSWLPWLAQGKCAISMVRTSNPEAIDMQDEELVDWKTGEDMCLSLYQRVAMLACYWEERAFHLTGTQNAVGGVIGATWPEQAVECRKIAGNNVFALIPGYGKQGGGAAGAVAGLPTSTGELLGTVNSSRGITMAWWDDKAKASKDGDPLELVAAEIDRSNGDLNAALTAKLGRDPYGVLAV